MSLDESISKAVEHFVRLNPTGINCVNKGAVTLAQFKDD